jgi:hypothetical protein
VLGQTCVPAQVASSGGGTSSSDNSPNRFDSLGAGSGGGHPPHSWTSLALACSSALVGSLRHTCRHWVSPGALARGATRRDPTKRPLWNTAVASWARNPLGSFVLCCPLSDSYRVWLKVCQLACIYGTTQLTPRMLAPGLLSGRQLPRWAVVYRLSVFWLVWSPTEEVIDQAYCAARLQILDRQYVGRGDVGRFLVGLPTQRISARVRLASASFSFPAVSAARRGLSTHLSADTPSPEDDRYALANGLVCGSADLRL